MWNLIEAVRVQVLLFFFFAFFFVCCCCSIFLPPLVCCLTVIERTFFFLVLKPTLYFCLFVCLSPFNCLLWFSLSLSHERNQFKPNKSYEKEDCDDYILCNILLGLISESSANFDCLLLLCVSILCMHRWVRSTATCSRHHFNGILKKWYPVSNALQNWLAWWQT